MSRLVLSILAIAFVLGFAPSSHAANCEDSTLGEVACLEEASQSAAEQVQKDFLFLTSLAESQNPKSIPYLKLGQMAFRNYVEKNCESEGHDAFGGSLQETLELKCRRDMYNGRVRLFERTLKNICKVYADPARPTEIRAVINMTDTESLRRKLDQIGVQAAATVDYTVDVKKLLRSTHVAAEEQKKFDAEFTCIGIVDAFCPDYSKERTDSERRVRLQWLSRCETEIRGAFYRRASMRLRQLRDN